MKESARATTITKRILDLRVNFTVGELITSVPAFEKQLKKATSENEANQFCVNILSLAETLEAANPYFWYSIRSTKVKTRLENDSKVTALLDTGAEINIMTKKLIGRSQFSNETRPQARIGLSYW